MFVQSLGTTSHRHKNGICIAQRRGGSETLVQWSNGDQRWEPTGDIEGKIVLVEREVRHAED